jgi:hypothetical protein
MENAENQGISGVTFVTCYVNIYDKEPYQHKNAEWRIEQFEYIAALGVQICLYGDDATMPYLEASASKFPNVRLMTMDTPYKETPIYQECLKDGLQLPERRYVPKDTVEYMSLMHAKIEFMNDAVLKNPWNSQVFAWMDFSMAYIFGNKTNNLPKIKHIADSEFINSFMSVPGCWEPIPRNNCSAIVNNIHWRFCGTFFIGDIDSMKKFHLLYREHYPIFIKEQNKLVWEVNFWAWLEANTDWGAKWYASDHNDRIINIPDSIFMNNNIA